MYTFQLTRSTRAPLLKTLLFSALCAMAVSGCELRVAMGKDAVNDDLIQQSIDQRLTKGTLVTVCLDGVQYWASTYHNLTLTPRFDPETREVRTCSTDAADREKSSRQ